MVCGIDPAVGHFRTVGTPLAFGYTPAAYVEIVLVLIRELQDALTVDGFQKIVLGVTRKDYLIEVAGVTTVVAGVETIFGDTCAVADLVEIFERFFGLAKFGASFGVVKIDFGKAKHHRHGPVALFLVVVLTRDHTENREIVGRAVGAGIAAEMQLDRKVALEFPLTVMERYIQVETGLAVIELLQD